MRIRFWIRIPDTALKKVQAFFYSPVLQTTRVGYQTVNLKSCHMLLGKMFFVWWSSEFFDLMNILTAGSADCDLSEKWDLPASFTTEEPVECLGSFPLTVPAHVSANRNINCTKTTWNCLLFLGFPF
jgi:hypothetical protein